MNATDYAHLHFGYPEDPDLSLIAETLEDEFGSGSLMWLYWPRLVTFAKSAKNFGWIRFTGRKLAASIHDNLTLHGGWAARERMFSMLAEADVVRVRQETGLPSASVQVDMLLVNYPNWQRMSPAEKSKLTRERKKLAAGDPVDWAVRHLEEFAFTSPEGNAVTGNAVRVTKNDTRVTEIGGGVTTLEKTRGDETEGARDRALPPTVRETLNMVRQIPGLSDYMLESNVRKAMLQFPSLPDSAICEAITAFENRIPEGDAIHSEKAWRLLVACFRMAGVKDGEVQAAAAEAARPKRRRLLSEVIAANDEMWQGQAS